MKAIFFLILTIIFIVLAVGFSSLNAGQIVTVKFLGLRMQDEFSFFISISVLFGLCLGVFLMSFGLIKNRLQIGQLKRKLLKAEASLKKATATLPAKV